MVKAAPWLSELARTIGFRLSVSATACDIGANDSAAVAKEEGHGVGVDVLGGHDQVALVLAVFVVRDQNHSTFALWLRRPAAWDVVYSNIVRGFGTWCAHARLTVDGKSCTVNLRS